jgi:hypothetical protein
MIEIAVGDGNCSEIAQPTSQLGQAGRHIAPRPRPTTIEQDRLPRRRLSGLWQPEVSIDAANAAEAKQTGDDFCAAHDYAAHVCAAQNLTVRNNRVDVGRRRDWAEQRLKVDLVRGSAGLRFRSI